MPFYRTLVSLFLVFSLTSVFGLQKPKQGITPQPDIPAYEKLIIHYRYDKPDSASYFAKKGLELAQRSGDEEGIARMLNQMGMIDDNAGRAESSRQKYLEALEIYKRLDNKKGIVKENIRLGVIENRDGHSANAISYFLQALKVSEKNHDKSGIMESYITLGEVYANQGNYLKAISYYKKAEKIGEGLPFSNLKLNTYSNFGRAYRELGDFERAKFYLEKGIGLSDYPEMMGLNISLINGLAQVYAKSGQIQKAIELQKGALAKSRKISNTIREFISLMALAESYHHLDPKISLGYLQEALALGKSRKANKQTLDALEKIAELNVEMHNYKDAYLFKSQQYSIADSFYFKAISLKIANLQAEYQLNKSQAKIEQLSFINGKQALEQRIMIWITGGSVLLLFTLAFYFYKIRNLNLLLNGSNAALTESNNVKDKLFSILAHDLRGPLASVINLLGLIDRDWLTEEEKKVMLAKLALQCNASMETLNLLLRWGQLQLKGIMINSTEFNPMRTIERNVSLLSDAAERKSISIETNVEPGLIVSCDADHLDFLIRNLVSNAIKFTPEGGHILIAAEFAGKDKVIFKVKDNGTGIKQERLESIFNFNNVSTAGTNNEKGTSLGLVISKEFVMANNGEIWVESVYGQGSQFFFSLKGIPQETTI